MPFIFIWLVDMHVEKGHAGICYAQTTGTYWYRLVDVAQTESSHSPALDYITITLNNRSLDSPKCPLNSFATALKSMGFGFQIDI